jgi:hypothetical protein
MAISPNKTETDAVIELLESEGFDTPKQMADAIVRRLSILFEERDSYGVGIGLPTDDVVLSHGPYHNLGDAKRVVATAQERGLRAFIAPLFGPARALPVVEEVVTEGACKCGHPRALHGERMTTFTGKVRAMSSLGCCVFKRRVQCPCTGYVSER